MSGAQGLRLVLADDHAPMRARLRQILEDDGCTICGDCATADEAVALTVLHHPDVALLDIDMPGGGIRAARLVAERAPGTAVVMLTMSRDDEDLFDSLRAGALGYLTKDGDPRQLPASLRAVVNGEAAMDSRVVMRLLDEFRPPGRRRLGQSGASARKLSPREWEIMSMLAEGSSTGEVAARLFISPTTVRVHVSTALRKLHVKDRKGAFRALRER